jgi:thioredoxin 1
MFDLYADWCAPCRMLSPLLEDIARENQDKVSVYKIDTDKNREIARSFNVTYIPYVVMMKNKKVVHSITGIESKEVYVQAINRYAATIKEVP